MTNENYLLIDCRQAGISGDMCLAVTTHLLQNWSEINAVLDKIVKICELRETSFRVVPTTKKGLHGGALIANILDDIPSGLSGAKLFDFAELISKELKLTDLAKKFGLKALKTLLEAEAIVHTGDSKKWEKTNLHEVGSVDTLVDIFGTAFQIQNWLGKRIEILPLNVGGGKVTFSHGTTRVPPPAVLEILRQAQLPWFETPDVGELVTPTGIALMSALGGVPITIVPPVTVLRGGVGHGIKELSWGNFCRFLEVQSAQNISNTARELLVVLETHVDDVPGEVLGSSFNSLLQEGALDIIQYPFTGKKNRPGIAVRVLVRPENAPAVKLKLIKELGTLGFREYICTRHHTARKIESRVLEIANQQFNVRIKFIHLNGKWTPLKPEHDDVIKIMEQTKQSWREILAEIYYQLRNKENLANMEL
ncbi:MAG: LarC family nickel insertion protein [Candidatus Hermodarchaeota archaeon]